MPAGSAPSWRMESDRVGGLARRLRLTTAARRAIVRGGFITLNYHHADRAGLAAHLAYLSARFKLVPLEESLEPVATRAHGRPRVAITFDDGYRDVYADALPVAETWRAPIAVFVVTRFVGTDNQFWWDRLQAAAAGTHRRSIDLAGHTHLLEGAAARARFCATVSRCVRTLPSPEAATLLERVIAELVDSAVPSTSSAPGAQLLDWPQLRDMCARGVCVGSHTETHPVLSRLRPTEARAELERSRETLATHLGTPPEFLAYPHGQPADVGQEVVALTRAAGYRAAFSTVSRPGPAKQDADRYFLPRTPADTREPINVLALRVSGLWPLVAWLRRYFAGG